MPNLSPQAQAVVTAFGSQPSVTHDHVNNLQAVINASPALIDQINDAVAQGHLKRIVPLTNSHAGGEYHGKNGEMHLPLAKLTTLPPNQTFDAGEVTFVLGHELQHGFNHAATMQAHRDFMKDARLAAKTDHDYTDEIDKLLAANRRDEAGAQIAGWNANVSRVKATNPNPTLGDIYNAQSGRMKDFIDESRTTTSYTYTLKPNLTLNPDLTLSPTPANLEAMGKNFFDKPPRYPGGLGHLGNSDYANHYGTWPIQEAAKLERQHNPNPQMTVNLSQLRLDEKLLEENGIDLGKNQQPMPYYDSSANPPRAGLFQHTTTTHQHAVPISAQAFEAEFAQEQLRRSSSLNDHQHVPVAPAAPNDQSRITANLQAGLIQLGYHHRVSQPLQVNGVNDTATQQAVTAFQAQHDLLVSGITDAATQQALQQALLAQQQAEQSLAEREAREKEQARSGELLPFSHPDHPQHAFYASLDQRFQARGHALSEAQLSVLTEKMNFTGNASDWQGDVMVRNGQAFVQTIWPLGARASIDMNAPTPSVQETMACFQDEQQRMAQTMEMLRQQQAMAQEHGHGLSR